jgi:hypothetical protein
MCKRHYKESIAPPMACQTIDAASAELHEGDPPDLQQQLQKQSPSRSRPAAVASVYEHILPSSITWHPHRSTSSSSSFSNNGSRHRRSNRKAAAAAAAASLDAVPQENQQGHRDDGHGDSSTAAASKDDVSGSGGGSSTAMPLILHLRHGRSKPFGWHRNEERTACGSDPVHVKAQLEPWERQLVRVNWSISWFGLDAALVSASETRCWGASSLLEFRYSQFFLRNAHSRPWWRSFYSVAGPPAPTFEVRLVKSIL